MAAKKVKSPFADTGVKHDNEGRERKNRARIDRDAMISRLMANADFREWLFGTLYTLCGFENEMRETTAFEQGIRAAGSLIRRELLTADGAPKFFAELDKRYYAGVRRGIIDAINGKEAVSGR